MDAAAPRRSPGGAARRQAEARRHGGPLLGARPRLRPSSARAGGRQQALAAMLAAAGTDGVDDRGLGGAAAASLEVAPAVGGAGWPAVGGPRRARLPQQVRRPRPQSAPLGGREEAPEPGSPRGSARALVGTPPAARGPAPSAASSAGGALGPPAAACSPAAPRARPALRPPATPAASTPLGGAGAGGGAPLGLGGLVRCELRGAVGRCPGKAGGWPLSLGEALGEAVVQATGMRGHDILVHVIASSARVTACVALCGQNAVAGAEALALAVNSGELLRIAEQGQLTAATPVEPALRQLLQRGVLFQAFQVTARHEWRLKNFKEQVASAPVVSSSQFTLAGARHLSLHLHLHGGQSQGATWNDELRRQNRRRTSTTAALMISAHAASRITCPFLFAVGQGAHWMGPFGRLDGHNLPGSTVCEIDDLLKHVDSEGTLLISIEAARRVAPAGTEVPRATPPAQGPCHRSERPSREPRAGMQEALAQHEGPAGAKPSASSQLQAPAAEPTAWPATAPSATPAAAPHAVPAAPAQESSAPLAAASAALPASVLAPAPVLASAPAALPAAAVAGAHAAAPVVAAAAAPAAAPAALPTAAPAERGAVPGQPAAAAARARARCPRAPQPQAAAAAARPREREAAGAGLAPPPLGPRGPACHPEQVPAPALGGGPRCGSPTAQGIIARLSDPAGALARLRAQMVSMEVSGVEGESGLSGAALPAGSASFGET
ncbi:unnamed protein product, partial [Prorocentrum cordatum]